VGNCAVGSASVRDTFFFFRKKFVSARIAHAAEMRDSIGTESHNTSIQECISDVEGLSPPRISGVMVRRSSGQLFPVEELLEDRPITATPLTNEGHGPDVHPSPPAELPTSPHAAIVIDRHRLLQRARSSLFQKLFPSVVRIHSLFFHESC
jgi:hypothetical protein